MLAPSFKRLHCNNSKCVRQHFNISESMLMHNGTCAVIKEIYFIVLYEHYYL